jgi:haloalkane dehalogenase
VQVLRTPEDQFTGLPDFGYPPHYADLGGIRMAYVEAGPPDGEAVLLLHGEPSWSFLYRTVMAVLAERGLRAIAPDLIGFGRSDKPTRPEDHSYGRHVEWVRAFAFGHLDLRGVTLVGQDWGGLIGLRLVAEHPDRFARVVERAATLDVARLVQAGCQTTLPPPVRAAYAAPFPDERFMAGPRAMPTIVPTAPDDPATEANRAAWKRLRTWDRPFLVAFSDGDPITGSMAAVLKREIPGAAGREHPVITGAGHFLQEDAGDRLGEVIADFARADG